MEPTRLVVNGIEAPWTTAGAVIGDIEFAIDIHDLAGGRRFDIVLRNIGREAVRLSHAGFALEVAPSLVLEHGFQMSSPVRRCRYDDVRQERCDESLMLPISFADSEFGGRRIRGDQFLLRPNGIIGFLDGKQHLSTVDADEHTDTALALLDGVVLLPGHKRRLDPIWIAEGEAGSLYSQYVELWAAEAGARRSPSPGIGWCSWYIDGLNVTPEQVLANLHVSAERGFDFLQIDAGWSAPFGDWLSPASGWPASAAMAADILTAGLVAGIWTAPFVADAGSHVARTHPEWLLRRPDTSLVHVLDADMLGPHPWYSLDTTRPEVLEHIRTVMAKLRTEGFAYHKADFLFAATLPAHRWDSQLTRAQALRQGLQAVRDGIGEDAFLLGCGSALAPAVGLVDAMRVSTDTDRTWLPPDAAAFAESRPAAVNAINNSVLRAPMHRRLFQNDPDCLLLRDSATSLTDQHRLVAAAAALGTGGYVVLSDDLPEYKSAQWDLVEHLRSLRPQADHPLDIIDPFADAVTVRGPCLQLEIDWRAQTAGVPRRDVDTLLYAPGPGPSARLWRR